MSVTESTSDSEMQVKTVVDMQSKNGDEQIEGMPVSDLPEFCDPAILVMREIRKRYSVEQLLKLREAPLSLKKPDFSDSVDTTLSIFDTDKSKKSESFVENGPRSGGVDGSDYRRRAQGDPRERIRKEDGIVLSPQRRSFNTGCFVPVREPAAANTAPTGSLGAKDTHMVREIQPGTRRIGSGRIVRDWDYNEKGSDNSDDFYKRNHNNNNGSDERRTFGRDFGSDKEKESRRTGRYNERRRISDHHREQEEPEWFSSGPISQNDTIELRGFDEPPASEKATAKKKMSPSRVKRYKEWVKKKSDTSTVAEEDDANSKSSSPPLVGNNGGEKGKETKGAEQMTLFDEMFTNSIPGLLPNGDDGADGKSRSSLWFKRESPPKMQQDNHHLIKDILNDIGGETKVSIPGDSDSYFAPISPAANTGGLMGKQQQTYKMDNIMEMLQSGAKNVGDHMKPPTGKIMNLDELEAKMRNNSSDMSSLPGKHQQKQQHEDIAAFNKLIQSLSGPKTQGMSLMEMLNDSQQQDEARAQMIGSNNSPNLGNMHNPNEIVDLQQQQQRIEMFNKLMNAASLHSTMRTSPNHHDIGLQQSRELLNRPEAKAILQAMHQRIPSPSEMRVLTQNILQRALIKKKLEEQQENYRKKQEMQQQRGAVATSPNIINNNNPTKNVGSPTQFAFTPTSVLRKMTADKDDTKDNKNDKQLPQGRPLTGIKMQPQQQQQWNQFQQMQKQPIGRPIVKANSNFAPQQQQQPPMSEQMIFQQLQQQRLYNQQQRKPNIYQQSNQQYTQQQPQLTQQQLRAQHQQHARPVAQQGQQQQPMGGSGTWQQFFSNAQQNNRREGVADGLSSSQSNQLAQWFSPDLLERARGGELPSTANLGLHALSLEEIERPTAPPVHN